MHEMSLAEGIRQIVEDAGRSQGFNKVKTVVLEIGQLSSVEPDSLRFCFDVVMQDSIAAGAVLQIDSVPGSGWCMQCAETVPVAALYDPCPKCGSYQVQATGGTEMRVKELEIE
ncbi:MAG: hydrogenase maturation nickel metallochaperone HypA [Proteobacteria bacterium]|uniref:hydrogenase maturation nickel metallochaperone HypA n=1 Tax=Zoogloea sp. TaxID=49181 RepID=UPI0035AE0B19|nr:hydrogenase maturation nickel metallochaperone HypA [Pseudomonadota bacterium]